MRAARLRGWLSDLFSLPPPFPDLVVEDRFLREYRYSGLRLAAIAFGLGALLGLTFLFIAGMAGPEDPTGFRQICRFLIVVISASAACLLTLFPDTAIRRYTLVLAIPLAAGFILLSAMTAVDPYGPYPRSGRVSLAIVLGLWLAYSLSRLSPIVIFFIGLIPGAAVAISAIRTHDDYVPAVIAYFVVANIVGWTTSVQLERRERALFQKARRLEELSVVLTEKIAEAASANEAKARVLATVGHDVRQPLASLALYVSILRDAATKHGTEVAVHVSHIDACLDVIQGGLNRLIEAARMHTAPTELAVTDVDVAHVLARVAAIYDTLARRSGVRLAIRVPATGRCVVQTNEDRLLEVISNLISNAIKYSARIHGREPWVLVRTASIGNFVRLDVTDNGVGIAPENHTRVFERYWQVGDGTRPAVEGFGLGLALVRETIARLRDHDLTLRSDLGRGSTFSLYMPSARASSGAVSGEEPVLVSERMVSGAGQITPAT